MADNARRTIEKVRAVRQAEFRLKQRLEAIDWRHDVLYPEIDEIKLKGTLSAHVDSTIAEIESSDPS